jgi:hypothetical protein
MSSISSSPPASFGEATIPGQKVQMGPYTWTVPPLNVAAWKKHGELLKAMTGGTFDANNSISQFEEIADLVYLILRRNYPDLPLDQFEDMADINKLPEIITAAMSVPEALRGKATAATPTGMV